MFNKNIDSNIQVILNNRFLLATPPDWKDNTVYSIEGPEEEGVKHNIFLSIENKVETSDLKKYAEMKIDSLENELQGYTELKKGELTLDQNIPAFELVYKWNPTDKAMYQKMVYVLSGQSGYTITATFSKKTFKLLGPVVDKIVKSFVPGERLKD